MHRMYASVDLEDLRRDTWHGGQLLAFSGIDGATDYDNALTARTAFGTPGLDIKIPGECLIRFPQNEHTANTVTGDWFQIGEGEEKTRGVLLDTHHLIVEGPCQVVQSAPDIAVRTDGIRTLIGAAAHFDPGNINADWETVQRERRRWLENLHIPSGLGTAQRRTLIKCLSVLKTQVYQPEGLNRHRWTTPDRWPHRRMWLWDSAFHAIGWRHLDPELARDAIAAVLDRQAPDGFIAHMMDPWSTSRITQPPVLALAVKLIHEVAPNDAWLKSVYPQLCAYVEWDMAHRDSDGEGLVEWAIEGNPLSRSGESGMDNSPRFDAATRMDAVDFNAFLAMEGEILAGMAAAMGCSADVTQWESRHQRLCRLIDQRLWSEAYGFYVDFDIERNEPSSVLASSGFLPLLCGAASPAQAQRLAEHLRDPDMFGTPFPVPSIAVRDTDHYCKDMWRGPVWINLNWLIARGFERYGFTDIAAGLRTRTVREIERYCDRFGVPFEFYDDRQEVSPPELLRKGQCAPDENPYHQVFHDYGWTASLYVDLVYSTHGARA